MEFLKTILKRVVKAGNQVGKPMADAPIVASKHSGARQRRGAAAEALACAFLAQQGLQLLARNYRTPGRGGGEIDLIMREHDGTVVFVEVRLRSRSDFGGAAASVDPRKQRRIVLAARHYLLGYAGAEPPCRFDVVVIQGQEQASSTTALAAMPSAVADQLEWLKAAFDAGST